MREEDLFIPIKTYFESFGYQIDGEVGHLDMLCEKDGNFLAIELKNDLNFKIFMQAAKQQKMFESVFIGCWTPKNLRSKAFLDKVYLLNRLGIGLIFVSFRTKAVTVFCEPIQHPLTQYKQRNRRKKEQIIKEFSSRRMKANSGGVHKKKLITAYRENSLIILAYLMLFGPSKASRIKQAIGIENAYSIVYQNHYQWFEALGKGVYQITDKGKEQYRIEEKLIKELYDLQVQTMNEEKTNEHI